MGRPLAKRFFGNRNLGTSGTADNFIGGEGVASVGSISAGTYASGATYPGITFSAPGVPGGVTALGTVTVRAKAIAAAPFGTQTAAYKVGQVLTIGTNGTTVTVATLAATVNLASVTIGTTANLAYTSTTTPRLPGTSVVVGGVDTAGCGLIPSTYYVSASPAPTATSCTLTDSYANALTGTNVLGATIAGATTGLTFATGNGGAAAAGALATVSTTPTAKGSYVLADGLIDAAQTTSGTAPIGAGATIKVSTYEVLSVTITEKGSGYINVADAAPTFGAGTLAATGASVLTVDAGRQGGGGNATTNQENAIIIRAKTTSGGTVLVGDIQSQKGSHRYKVKTTDGTAVCKLVTTTSAAVKQGYILATDITGNEYFVTKITSRKCVITRKSGGSNYEFANPATYPSGQVVKWTLGTQVLNSSVKIENA